MNYCENCQKWHRDRIKVCEYIESEIKTQEELQDTERCTCCLDCRIECREANG